MSQKVHIVEVGPRDGLQSIAEEVSTVNKVKFIDMLTEAICPEIEVASFVSPKWVPQMADAKEITSLIKRKDQIIYTALVPNVKGLENAIKCGYHSVAVLTAASESFSLKNTNCRIRGYISTCWVCPYEGNIGIETVIKVIQYLIDLGVDEISLGDTIGKATPEAVEHLLEIILDSWPPELFALHMHDTYNMASENIVVGLGMGLRIIDSSAGGVGGCPYAPGAAGNVSTETVARICMEQGFETGIDIEKLKSAGNYIQSITQ